ncbi:putative DNA-binding domain-containing protein [Bordetella holmesii]|uniref:PF09836 family protein n=2 Tax=Bordetella holmesii TaxID=35814 RepID=A0A158M1R0_9BORD|nr:putative DNA-binding domain-containing protein [Bordetella holmesii]AHV93275.1 hypothetical protein D560_1251 [Bordetella holmesii ATCC 51541]AIT25918.1 hypothetical protein D558_1240 [Bordetella holmesii 44057]EWM46487.1 hypothetical protein D555_1262 [Bordetella holmesii 35009]EWM50653.1 hypothetical protein D557_0498 [Bordetella holmesii 70147]AMD45014.1 hypothetical protein H558_05595 [Bordetella holmesii H558]
MSAAFYDYVRGLTDRVPPGYSVAGMRVYRYLVYLGASQMVEASFPGLRQGLGEPAWRALIEGFVRQSAWTSHFYGDLQHEFREFLARTTA